MASFSEAKVAGEQAWDAMQVELQMRPSVVGVVRKGSGFGLRITLPRTPSNAPPASLLGVPVEYRVSDEGPELLGTGGNWRKSLAMRRSKS